MEYLDLVKRAKSGNEEAFIRLMELQSDCMYKMAKTILKNEEDVADAMAETVLTCWEKISTLRKNRYVKTWMIRILLNKCYDLLRKKELLLTEDAVTETSIRETGYGLAEWEQVLQTLDEKYRLVMLLYYVEGFKIREVSEVTADKNTGRRAGGNGSGRVHRSILHQSGNHGYCVAEYYRSEFQPSGVFGKRILGRNERTARL